MGYIDLLGGLAQSVVFGLLVSLGLSLWPEQRGTLFFHLLHFLGLLPD